MTKAILSVILFLILADSAISKEQQDSHRNEADSARKQQDSPNLPTPWLFDKFTRSAWEKIQIEPNWSDPDCISPKDHDEADLCQQRSVAKAADVTVYLNIGQIFINVAGLIALIITIRLTYRATRAAEKAAEISLEQSRIANEQAQIARTAAEVPLRAFLVLDYTRVSTEGVLVMRIINKGKTPANLVRIKSRIYWVEQETSFDGCGNCDPINIQIMPKQTAEFTCKFNEFSISADNYISGDIIYNDWFGNDCKTRFHLVSNGDIIRKPPTSHAI